MTSKAWRLPVLLAALAGPAAAREAKAGDLVVKDPVVRAVAPGVPNTAGYMTVVNTGSKADKLMGAACACARSVDVHLSHVMNGQAMMMPSGPVAIPAGRSVAFAPGGYHLMVVGLKTPLQDGASQELTLKFQRAGQVKVAFDVKAKIAMTTPPAPMSMPR